MRGSRRAAAVAAVAAVVAIAACDDTEPIDDLGALPAFELTDQDGAPLRASDLRGRVWIASFIFTSCATACPLLTTQMANLQRRMAGRDVRFVSISVDPEVDTPAKLKAHAARFGADESTWRFVTGERAAVRSLVVDGFRVGLGEREALTGGGYDIPHALRFTLVDRAGHVRGHYPTDGDGLARLERDAVRLLAEPG